jgi:Septum formation
VTDDDAANGSERPRSASIPPPVPATVGWGLDPFGRFAARYWDGNDWTDQVLDHDGHLGTDAEPLRDPAAWLAAEAAAHAAQATSAAAGAPPGGSGVPPRYSPPPYPPPYQYRSRRSRKPRPVRAGSAWLKGFVILGVVVFVGLGVRFVIIKEHTEAVRRTLLSLAPGDCVTVTPEKLLPNATGVAFSDLDVVSCTKPHLGEVIYAGDYPASAPMPYTDDGARILSFTPSAAAWVQLNCFDPFTSYVGRPPLEQTQYDIAWVMPGPKLWSSGTRRSACFVTNLDHSLLARPLKGTTIR